MPNPGHDGPSDPRLVDAWEAYQRHGGAKVYGSKRLAADELGIPWGTLDSRIKRYQAFTEADPAVKRAAAAIGSGMVPSAVWTKTDKAGNVSYSVLSRPEKQDSDPAQFLDALREGLEAPAPERIARPKDAPADLCAVFPVADLHIGMLADAEEVGENWDGKIAGRVFERTFGRLVDVTPAAGTAILAQLGDLMHVDDQRNMTPQSGHLLDADTRYFMILRRAVAAMKWAIDRLRAKFASVIYRGCRGNHDMTAHYAVTIALAEHYRDVEGVEIVESANEFFMHEFGANMIVLHHGDKVKPERLAHFVADQWAEAWGRTRHRLALSGHIHHAQSREVGGLAIESVGTIIPRDAYAYSHGYSAKRALVSIVLDAADGEISRAKVAA